MTFTEQQRGSAYEYHTEDVFGSITLTSSVKLEAEKLDEVVVALLRQNLPQQKVEGVVEDGEKTLAYTFVKAPQWEEDAK